MAFCLTTYSMKNKKLKKIMTGLGFWAVYNIKFIISTSNVNVCLTVGGNDPLEMLFIIRIQKTTYSGFPVFAIAL